jgi:hypothetical protein
MANWWEKNIDQELSEILIKFKLTLNNKEIIRDWRTDCKINYEHLEDDLEDMPSIYAFWTAILSEARKKLRIIEFQIDIQKAKILKGVKIPEGIKLTVADKENIVTLDVEYNQLIIKQIELESTVSKLFGIVDSLKMKSDNLRSLAGFKRAELTNS